MAMLDTTLSGLFLVDFLINSAAANHAPFFPLLGETNDLSLALVGIAASCSALGAMSFSICSTLFTLHRRALFFSGAFIAGMSTLLYAGVQELDSWSLFAAAACLRLFQGLGAAMVGAYITSVVTHVYKDQAETLIGVQQTVSTLGTVLGPALGALTYAFAGFSSVFLFFGVSLLLATAVPACFMKTSRLHEVYPERLGARVLLRSPRILTIAGALLVSVTLLGSLEVTLAVHLHRLGVSASTGALLFMITPGAAAVAFFPLEWLMLKASTSLLIPLGLFFETVGILIIGPTGLVGDSVWLVIGGLILIGLGLRFVVTPAVSEMAGVAMTELSQTRVDSSNAVASLFIFSLILGELFGPLIAGTLAAIQGLQTCCTVVALVGGISTIAFSVGSVICARKSTAEQASRSLLRKP